ncbi:hypothetical protein OQZ33_21880 [Pedobacter sp. MC2016-05]|uniref:hypothetical protein n=1 Tax=Pedobacter sp. MC2016-05 TaxID=2994474 RepID=UPI002245AA0B|nr:hypothetical protein [Pedobacter sp. MC2016-05]MCX2476999.1 hypothetical protein [Pedobacter sp. MC2016-05]
MKNRFITRLFSTLILLIGTFYVASAQVVTVDNYFNQETKPALAGKKASFHYLWNDESMTGFSIFGNSFRAGGAKVLNVLAEGPTASNLNESDIYIIVDPDNLKDNPNPNFMNDTDADAIAKWVKAGGVLFLLANDEANADLIHFNILAKKFGFMFNNDLILHVTNDEHFADGGLNTGKNEVFSTSRKIFIKDASSIKIINIAAPVLKTPKGENVIVVATYGKGTVLAVGDPWLYNEYTNGRLPATFQNNLAANDVANYLIKKARKK